MKMIFFYAEESTTDGKRYLLGYELGDPSTGDVVVLERSERMVLPLRR